MARKSTDFTVVVHYPDNYRKASHQEIFDEFRLEQIKKFIAGHPPKVQLALLEELERRLSSNNM